MPEEKAEHEAFSRSTRSDIILCSRSPLDFCICYIQSSQNAWRWLFLNDLSLSLKKKRKRKKLCFPDKKILSHLWFVLSNNSLDCSITRPCSVMPPVPWASASRAPWRPALRRDWWRSDSSQPILVSQEIIHYVDGWVECDMTQSSPTRGSPPALPAGWRGARSHGFISLRLAGVFFPKCSPLHYQAYFLFWSCLTRAGKHSPHFICGIGQARSWDMNSGIPRCVFACFISRQGVMLWLGL